MTDSVNDKLYNQAVRHGINVDRFANYEIARVKAWINNEIIPKIKGQISRFDNVGMNWHTKAQESVLERIARLISEDMNKAAKGLNADLSAFAKAESVHMADTINRFTGMQITAEIPDLRSLASIVSDRPFQGQQITELFKDITPKAQKLIISEIRDGLFRGQSVADIVDRVTGTKMLTGTFKQINNEAERIVRSSVMHVSSHARQATYLANDDIINGYQIVGTLDTHICEICIPKDGELVTDLEDYSLLPPYHFNCRCTSVPSLKSWKELGIDLKEAPEGFRASMDGEVSDRLTAKQWIDKQDLSVQRDVLGKTKANLYNQGLIRDLGSLTDQNQVLNLRQIMIANNLSIDDIEMYTPKGVLTALSN